MPVLRLTQVIQRPVAEVFETVIHVEDFPKWNPTIKQARTLSDGPPASGSRFEMNVKGFGPVPQVLQEFERDKRVKIVPEFKVMGGGHRFTFTAEGQSTRIDHELEMFPKGIFKLFTPFLGVMGRKNLRDTASALQGYLESRARR